MHFLMRHHIPYEASSNDEYGLLSSSFFFLALDLRKKKVVYTSVIMIYSTCRLI